MTAHSRIATIRNHVSIPILNGIELVHNKIRNDNANQPVALLATNGSIASGVYTNNAANVNWIIPSTKLQEQVQSSIYNHIKAGRKTTGLVKIRQVMQELQAQGAKSFVLGCTELGLVYDHLHNDHYRLIEPLRLLAQEIVHLSNKAKTVDTPTMISYTAT